MLYMYCADCVVADRTEGVTLTLPKYQITYVLLSQREYYCIEIFYRCTKDAKNGLDFGMNWTHGRVLHGNTVVGMRLQSFTFPKNRPHCELVKEPNSQIRMLIVYIFYK